MRRQTLARGLQLPPRGRELRRTAGHAIGGAIDRAVTRHYRRRLETAGWLHALTASEHGFAAGGFAPRQGNSLEVLIDGAAYLPAVAEELARAESHVHLLGWHFSPELDLTRGAEPTILRNLLADLAERVDVRLLLWTGAPFAAWRPSRRDVRRMVELLCRSNGIRCEVDSCVRFMHAHHEKSIVIDDRVAFVGGIDLTLDGGDPFDSPSHIPRGRVGWHDVATCLRGPIFADVSEHFRLLWHGPTGEPLPAPIEQAPDGQVTAQLVRTFPERVFERTLPRGDFSVLESYMRALRSAERFVYLENQFLWSPEIVGILADKLRNPPCDGFRVVVLLPAKPNDGADVSRGQVAALIHADDGDARFLACTVYARHRALRDTVYVHAKVGIVDDRWLTIGSANLNERSLFDDSELNVVTLDAELARETRIRLWTEHLELPRERLPESPQEAVDEHWVPIADEQLARLEAGQPLTHRLVKLPGVSVRHRRILGPLESRIYDL